MYFISVYKYQTVPAEFMTVPCKHESSVWNDPDKSDKHLLFLVDKCKHQIDIDSKYLSFIQIDQKLVISDDNASL